jgi:aspartate racemase
MSKHIGIVACSAEGAALCYRTICNEGSISMGRHDHPEISMHNYPLHDYMEKIYRNDWEGVAELMLASAGKLKNCGADFLICPDNTIHQAFDGVLRESPLPWLHIASEVAKTAVSGGYRKSGILGTIYLMNGPVYKEKYKESGLESVIPSGKEMMEIDRIIFEELVNGEIKKTSEAYLYGVIERLKSRGCDSVVLGCTEIPLIVMPVHSPLPVLDSTRILARAALREAI